MTSLTFLRHGQSVWNLENRFTGWVDVDLTPEGEAQARAAGRLLREAEVLPERAYTSVLTRAIRTLNLALDELGRVWIPVEKDWRLNERHYGGLTGLNKAETAAKHGDEQVKIWRRSYDTPPPPMPADHPNAFGHDPRYARLPAGALPSTESLKTTLDRVIPYWESAIAPKLLAGEHVIVAAHGNSIRALIKHLFAVPDGEIVNVEVPTGNPLVVTFATGSLSVRDVRYLDAERATALPEPASA